MHARDMCISRRQIAMLHAVKRDQRIDEKTYRQILAEGAGVTTSKVLTQSGFDAVLDLIEALFSDIPGRRRSTDFAARTGRANPAQLRYIESMGQRLFADGQGFRHWLERFFRASDLRFLTPDQARRVIEALKAMSARGWPHAETDRRPDSNSTQSQQTARE